MLPELTTKALTCTDFYLAASHLSSGVSMGAEAETLILCKVAMDSPRESVQLILTCLSDIYGLRSSWPADDRREKLLHGLLLNLLRIRDSKQTSRISVFFEDPQVGLLPVLKSQLIERSRYNNINYSQAEAVLARYTNLWYAAGKIPAVNEWVENNEEARLITQRDGANRGARGRGGVSHGGRGGSAGGGGGSGVRHGEVDSGDDSDTSSGEPSDLKVQGAGFPDLDGRYKESGESDGVPYYTQRKPAGEPAGVVYRCKVDGAAGCKWIMSIFSNNGHQRKDIPLYESSAVSSTPPTQGWRCIPGSLASQEPSRNRAPVVLMKRESAMDMDDDDDENFDTSNNNDDLSTETPVGDIPSSLEPADDDMMDTSNNHSPGSPPEEGGDEHGEITRQQQRQQQPHQQPHQHQQQRRRDGHLHDLITGPGSVSTPSSSPTAVSTRTAPPAEIPRSRGRARHTSGSRQGSRDGGGGSGSGGSSSAAI